MRVARFGGRGGRALPASWAVMVLVALLAFSWQSVVTRTHAHFAFAAPLAAGSKAAAGAPSVVGRSSPAAPATCPICQEIARAGAYLPSTPVMLRPPAPFVGWRAVVTRPASIVRQGSHAWHSRAPPRQLQA